MSDEIEVYQDFNLKGPAERRVALREALIEIATGPWHPDVERATEIIKASASQDDVILFKRDNADSFPAVGLTLWSNEQGYYVPNIVPLKTGQLTFGEYNAALSDFIKRVVEPVAAGCGFEIETTEAHQGLGDWVGENVATLLRRFSDCANKSTGASHPMDQERWFAFLAASHREHRTLDAERLARWLHEASGWDFDTAHRLAGQYERAIALLDYYDRH